MKISFSTKRLSIMLLLLTLVLLLCSGSYILIKAYRPQWFHTPEIATNLATTSILGFVDKLNVESTDGGKISVLGWAVSNAGIARVELVLNGKLRIPLTIAVPRVDVAQAFPGYPDSSKSGFEGTIDITSQPIELQTLELVVIDKQGGESVLTRRTLPTLNAKQTWSDLLKLRRLKRDDVFYFIMATSNLASGGATDVDTIFGPTKVIPLRSVFGFPFFICARPKAWPAITLSMPTFHLVANAARGRSLKII